MTGISKAFIYTASLCKYSSWRKSSVGALETKGSKREEHGHIKRFVLLHSQHDQEYYKN